jgi:hypothetical protein
MYFIEVINKNSNVIVDVMERINPTQVNIDNNKTCTKTTNLMIKVLATLRSAMWISHLLKTQFNVL